ncbi:MAG TPA: hypothetical protein IAA29_04370 [Candidatus Paenibacillus intestinavium]|nr:hypothetical protein [Candidatus Paenibacillus intestinavium]
MLFKHTIRYILQKNRWLFAAISALLIIMSVLFFSLISLNEKMNQVVNIYESNSQEDFQFIPKQDGTLSIEETVNNYAETYKFDVEQQHLKLVMDKSISYKILKQQHLVNKPYYLFGKASSEANEIVIDVNTAKRLQLEVGDSYEFLNQSFEISGIAGFPAQIQPNMKLKGFGSYHSEHAVLVGLSDETFNQVEAEEKVYYGGIWSEKATNRELDSEQFYMIKYAADNVEMNSLSLKISMNQMIAGISIGVLMTIVLVMLAMLVYKMIKDNQEIYGILKGIGYKNRHIISSFLPIIIILIIPIVLGKIISVLFLLDLFVLMNQDGIIPYLESNNGWLFFIIVAIIFVFVTAFSSMMFIAIMLRKSPISLIRGVSNEKNSKFKRVLLKITTRKNELLNLRNKFALRNPFVLGLMIFTGFALAVQLLLSFAMFEFPQRIVQAYEEQFTYSYDIRFSETLNVESSNEYIAYRNKAYTFDYKGKQEEAEMYILQQGESNSFIQFIDYNTGRNITNRLSDGAIISKWFANKYDLQVGDELALSQSDLYIATEIVGIHKGLQGNEVYTTVSYYNDTSNEEIVEFDGLYIDTLTHPSFNEAQISIVNELEETLLAVKQSTNQYQLIGLILLIIGIVLSIILMSIALYIMLQNNKDQILLFKAMGYRNKEIFIISINGYLYPLSLGIVVAIPYFLLLGKLLFGMISKGSSLYIPMEISIIYICILSISAVLFFYLISSIFIYSIFKDRNFMRLMNI